MDCRELQDRIDEFIETAFVPTGDEGALHAPEMHDHLATCESCRVVYQTRLEAWAAIGMAAKNTAPADIEDRLLARVLSESARTTDPSSGPIFPTDVGEASSRQTGWKNRWLSYGLAATILLSLVGTQIYYLQRISSVASASRDPSDEERMAAFDDAVAELNRLQLESSETQFILVSMSPGEKHGSNDHPNRGHAIWDNENRELHFFGSVARKLPANKQFVVWFADGDSVRRVKSFDPNPDSVTTFIVRAPADIAAKKVLITVDSPSATTPSRDIWCTADLR